MDCTEKADAVMDEGRNQRKHSKWNTAGLKSDTDAEAFRLQLF